MSIKIKIGQRIKEQRLSKGLTRKALSELTGTLKATTINNYERGDRTPGPEEIQKLAVALNISPSFLMCLTDDNLGEIPQKSGLLIPILETKHLASSSIQYLSESQIMIHPGLASLISTNAFALEVKDLSMIPEFKIRDIIVIDPDIAPAPGDFVVAKMVATDEVVLRKYRQINAINSKTEFELIALNPDWVSVKITDTTEGIILGTVINLTRYMKIIDQ